MPKGTRVHRCVSKLRKKYKYSKAIGICQKSTKQNYMTGKQIRQTKYEKKRRKKKTRKKRGGTGEPNDGLIYARDFVNVAREPENGWANWQWDPNTPLPSLKVPIGSKYVLFKYDNSYEPEMDIIELGSQRPYYRNPDSDDPTIAINFKIVGEHEGYTFKPEDWNKRGGTGEPNDGLIYARDFVNVALAKVFLILSASRSCRIRLTCSARLVSCSLARSYAIVACRAQSQFVPDRQAHPP